MGVGRKKLLVDSLRRLAGRGATPHLRRILDKTRGEDLAEAMSELAPKTAHRIFVILLDTPEQAAEMVATWDPANLQDLFVGLKAEQLQPLFQELSPDDAADILAELPEEQKTAILEALEEQKKEDLEQLMLHAEDSAGGIMSPDFFAIDKELTAREAVVAVRESPDAEMVFYLYVVNEEGTLVGVLSLRQLVLAGPATQVRDVMESDVISVPVTMDQEDVASLVARYDLLALPVVDEFNKLVGIITVDDIIDVLRDEATEDMMKMAGLGDEDVATRGPSAALKIRLPWLVTSMAGGMGAALLISMFGQKLSQAVALVGFIPVVSGLGGNVGVQSATLVVRGVAMGQLDPARSLAIVISELKVGLALAVVLGLGSFAVAGAITGGLWAVAATVCASIATVILFAAVVGTGVPLLFHRLGVDPAVATGPILTTSIDITGISILFLWATAFHLFG